MKDIFAIAMLCSIISASHAEGYTIRNDVEISPEEMQQINADREADNRKHEIARKECEFEATKAIASTPFVPFRSMFAQMLDQGTAKAQVFSACMQAKGY